MQISAIIKDNEGNVGNIPLVWGESRVINAYLINPDGTPFVYTGTPSEILVKIFSNINQTSIKKKLSLSQVSLFSVSGIQTGVIGIQFTLLASETPNMAANNSGLPMSIAFTDSENPANVLEIDFESVFNVSQPRIQT
jgi:hypothetical protein